MKRFAFFMGHPAHYHLFKNVINALQADGHTALVISKSKDMLDTLLAESNWRNVNIAPGEVRGSKLHSFMRFAAREGRAFRAILRDKPDLLIGSMPEAAHIGRILGIPSIVLAEDDASVVPIFARVTFPFATTILAPEGASMGRWEYKTRKYPGFHKLAYLHPSRFTPDPSVVGEVIGPGRYFLIRLVSLRAHHDTGIRGISDDVARELIARLTPFGRVVVSAERALPPDLEPHRALIAAGDIHHLIAGADLFVSDSQSMTVESAMLGTPSIRFSDFAGKIGVLEQLEHQFRLTIGIRADNPAALFDAVNELVRIPNIRLEWTRRRDAMLQEKIDVSAFLVWFMSNYPASDELLVREPGYLRRAQFGH